MAERTYNGNIHDTQNNDNAHKDRAHKNRNRFRLLINLHGMRSHNIGCRLPY